MTDGSRDFWDEVSLANVGRPRPSTMNAASSVPADPGSQTTGRCGGQGSLGRSDRTRAWPPRTRSPSPDTPQAWTQHSRTAPEETAPELDRWTGSTRGPRGHANPRQHRGQHADPLCVHTIHRVECGELADRAIENFNGCPASAFQGHRPVDPLPRPRRPCHGGAQHPTQETARLPHPKASHEGRARPPTVTFKSLDTRPKQPERCNDS